MIQKGVTYVLPKLKGYTNIKNVVTVQGPSEFSSISAKEANKIMTTLKENSTVYNGLRGQINAMADQSGHRLNILFSESNPGMLEVTIAPKSAATTRELADEFSALLKDPDNAGKHLKEIKRMIVDGFKTKEGETVMRHVVDPKSNFLGELRESLYKLIENAEFRKYAK